MFTAVGVRWVSERLTRVYEARDAAGAARIVDQFAGDTAGLAGITPTGAGVPGFPAAKCFGRADWTPTKQTITANRVWWHFKCIAQADRYAFLAFSDREQDVKQQISAQYRILAGE
ncbi:MAG TPA: hypothetical protein VML93_03540 [Mycobacterium sp.]|nr:hypothetical protein [Mycobacterium sp.]HTQ16418.1 hypothetical protein [Mycobacterium sp.]